MKRERVAQLSLLALLILLVVAPAVTIVGNWLREQADVEGFQVPPRTAYTARIPADHSLDASLQSLRLRDPASLSRLYVVSADQPLAALLALRLCGGNGAAGLIIIDPESPPGTTDLEALSALVYGELRLIPVGDIPSAALGPLKPHLEGGFSGTDGALAVAVDSSLRRERGTSERVLIVPEKDMDFALPAATWVARTGDAVFPVGRDGVCPQVADHLRDRQEYLSPERTQNIYLLAPRSAAGSVVLEELSSYGQAVRVAGSTPEDLALSLARFHDDGTQMGWDAEVPHDGDATYYLGNAAESAALLATAQLAADGPCGPLLLTPREALLPEVETFLWTLGPDASVPPGDGSRQFAWIAGGGRAISGGVQSNLDRINAAAAVSVRQFVAYDILSAAWLISSLLAGAWVAVHSAVRRPDMEGPVRLLWILAAFTLGLFGVAGYVIAQRGEGPPVTTRARLSHAAAALTAGYKTTAVVAAFVVLTALLSSALGRQLWVLPPPLRFLERPEAQAFIVGYLLALALILLIVEPALHAKKADSLSTRIRKTLPATLISVTSVAAVTGLALRWIRWHQLHLPPLPTTFLWYGTISAAAIIALLATYPLHYWIATGAMQYGTLE